MATGGRARDLSGPGSDDLGVRPPGDPVTGWRYWQVTAAGPPRLRSVSQRRFEWIPGAPLRAACVGGGHAPPAPGCGCGVYGATDLARLRTYGLCLSPGALVVGEVDLWGRVLFDERGYRAERGYPRRLWLVRESVPEEEQAATMDVLRAYRVPIGVMSSSETVGDISAALIAAQAMARLTALPPA